MNSATLKGRTIVYCQAAHDGKGATMQRRHARKNNTGGAACEKCPSRGYCNYSPKSLGKK